jgi:hypothetical protein
VFHPKLSIRGWRLSAIGRPGANSCWSTSDLINHERRTARPSGARHREPRPIESINSGAIDAPVLAFMLKLLLRRNAPQAGWSCSPSTTETCLYILIQSAV